MRQIIGNNDDQKPVLLKDAKPESGIKCIDDNGQIGFVYIGTLNTYIRWLNVGRKPSTANDFEDLFNHYAPQGYKFYQL